MHIITVTKKTTAKPQAIWGLWENVPERTRWDDLLERAQLRGQFQPGVRGVVKLKEQPERTFEIVDCVPLQEYTDRFFLPTGGKMDCEVPPLLWNGESLGYTIPEGVRPVHSSAIRELIL